MSEEKIKVGNAMHTVEILSGEMCASIVQATPNAIFVCGLDERILLANPAFAALFGLTSSGLAGRSIHELQPSEMRGMAREQNADVLETGTLRVFEFTADTAHGGRRSFLVAKGICSDSAGQPLGIFGIIEEITARRLAELEIMDTIDKEKQRLGRELRENFCQHLVGISLLGNVLNEELSRAGIAQAEFARQITSLVKQIVSEVRTIEKGLSVLHLEQGEGLAEALEDLAAQVRSNGDIECDFRGPRSQRVVEPQTAMYLFRIAQEALHNALAHSMARRISIRLFSKRDAVVLSVKDNGIGLLESEQPRNESQAQIGFSIMRHRSRALGAKLEIKHVRGGGVEVLCTVPRRRSPRRRNKI